MMNLFKNSKVMGGLVLVVAIAGVAYYYWGMGATTGPVVEDTAPVASQELLLTLSNLRTIQLNNALFTNPLFVSLSDFGVTIPPQPVGRRNPFAPVGSQTP